MTGNVAPGKAGITFQVHDVVPAREPLRECFGHQALRNLLADPRQPEAASGFDDKVVDAEHYHALLAATHLAFSQHRPLVLSPDMIWTCIAQGLAQHVANHAEALRSRFVKHKGKLTLMLQREGFVKGDPNNPWPEAFAEFGAMIRAHVGDDIHAMMVADFSTTGPVERAVSEVVMMDAFQNYFDYIMLCVCGIPEITLEGEVGDWVRLRAKAEWACSFGMEWWAPHLLPICDQFVRASQGEVDLEHWGNIYKLHDAYGEEMINGWMAKLIPYIRPERNSPPRCRNPLLEQPPVSPGPASAARSKTERLPPPRPTEEQPEAAIYAQNLPTGISVVPLLFVQHQTSYPMEILGGFTGITQAPGTHALRPKLGWGVRDAEPIDMILADLERHHRLLPWKERPGSNREPEGSAEILKFYSKCDGAVLFPDAAAPISVVPQEERRRFTYSHGGVACLSPWYPIIRLPDGSCYAYVSRHNTHVTCLPLGLKPDWVFVQTDYERTHRTGRYPIVATTFSELLIKIINGGPTPFHQLPSFQPLGFAEIDH